MKNLLHRLLLPAALLLAGGAANIPARSTSPAAGTAPGPSPRGRGDASVAFRAPRSIPPTGLRPWVPLLALHRDFNMELRCSLLYL